MNAIPAGKYYAPPAIPVNDGPLCGAPGSSNWKLPLRPRAGAGKFCSAEACFIFQ